jgi:hypothetical protein
VSASFSQTKNSAERLLVEEEEQEQGNYLSKRKGLKYLRKARQDQLPQEMRGIIPGKTRVHEQSSYLIAPLATVLQIFLCLVMFLLQLQFGFCGRSKNDTAVHDIQK